MEDVGFVGVGLDRAALAGILNPKKGFAIGLGFRDIRDKGRRFAVGDDVFDDVVAPTTPSAKRGHHSSGMRGASFSLHCVVHPFAKLAERVRLGRFVRRICHSDLFRYAGTRAASLPRNFLRFISKAESINLR